MEWVKLGDVVEFVLSGEWGKEVTDLTKIASPVIRTTNFNNDGTIDYKDIVYRDIDLEKKQDKLIKKGDILIEKSGGSPNQPVGRVVYFDAEDSKFFNNNFTSILRLNSDYHSKYIFYLFRYLYKIGVVNKFQNKTTGIINLKLKDYLQQTNVLIHKDKEEQKVCFESLDLIFDIISTRKAQIAALDELVQSVFYDMFENKNFESVKLGEKVKVNPPKSEVKNLDKDLEVTFLPMENVSETGEVDLSEIRNLSEVYSGFTYAKNGDVVVAKITPSFENGKGAYLTNLLNGITFGTTEFHVLRPKKISEINYIWLYYLTMTKKFRMYGELNMSGSAGQKRISKAFIENYEIALPPLELQEQFAAKVEAIESQKSKLKASLEEMETLFDALMQEAFSGNLG